MAQSLSPQATTATPHGWSFPVGPCVWMSAGLVSYRLCDHDYDCEHCPLDAALRGGRSTGAAVPAPVPCRPYAFPNTLGFSPGHLWFAPATVEIAAAGREPPSPAVSRPMGAAPGRLRLGLDAFAASLVGAPLAVRAAAASAGVGEPLCSLELGGAALALSAPFAARDVMVNEQLDAHPELAASDSYGAGWLVELSPVGDGAPAGFDGAAAALRSRLDLRHFRHRVAADLLADSAGVGATLPDGGEVLTDLRGILGLRRYVELLREVIH